MSKKFKSLTLAGGIFLAGALVFTACDGTQVVEPEEELTVTWSGVNDITLSIGDDIPDFTEGVTATASDGTALTVNHDEEMSDTVNTSGFGVYTVWLYATDADGNIVDEDDTGYVALTVTVEQGVYIDNSTFDTGTTGWSGNGNSGSAMSYSWDEEEQALRVDITNSGEEYWQNQVETSGLNVSANTTYVISFSAKATTNRNISAGLEALPSYDLVEANFTNSVGLELSSEWETYSFYYTADDDYESVKLGIYLGRYTEADDAESTVWIDDVYVTRLSTTANTTGVTFEGVSRWTTVSSWTDYQNMLATETITAYDADGNDITDKLEHRGSLPNENWPSSFTSAAFGEEWLYWDDDGNLSYYKRQIGYTPTFERENAHDLLNADFDNGMTYWTLEDGASYTDLDYLVTAEAVTEDGRSAIKITSSDTTNSTDWHAQFYQSGTGAELTVGNTYRFEVTAKIETETLNGYSETGFTDSTGPKIRIEFCGDAHKTDLAFTATGEWQTFSYTWTPTDEDISLAGSTVRSGILLGEFYDQYTLYVDSMQIVLVEE